MNEYALVVIDFQERMIKHIHGAESITKNTDKLIRAFKILGMPIIYTEQINLGKIIFDAEKPIKKKTFSCYGNKKFIETLKKINCRRILLVGIETHICVLQTAIDLITNGYDVFIATDCTGSRKEYDKIIAIERIKQEGIKLATAEAIIYEILESSEAKEFKEILKIVKE
ncbi:MAG: isochorismatase family protein [Thermoplasmata archaeon]|nr:isochorismatase family protein [Thermoplasmata archaeon]